MILTVVGGYVSNSNKYNNAFVHSRVKAYLQDDVQAKVFLLTNRQKPSSYEYEGVEVIIGDVKDFVLFVQNNDIQALCFHFFQAGMIEALEKIKKSYPVFIFVHGHEALKWHERLFPDKLNSFIPFLKFIKYMGVNTYNIKKIRSYFKKSNHKNTVVCVSEWMKDITVKNWDLKKDVEKVKVIPNIVNEDIFNYCEKDLEQRYNLLMIRSFANGKYAVDQAINVIKLLSEHEKFPQINIKIVGRGRLFNKYISKINKHKNIEIHEGFLNQNQIAEVHKKFGMFLCPTRQDAQGVSMCEAMSSGLIPITSNNTAIPEFVPESFGVTCETEQQMANRIIEIIENPILFKELSANSSKVIREKCSRNKTTEVEIKLIKEAI